MRSTEIALYVLFAFSGVPAAGQLPAGYVGSEVCQTCHEDIYNAFFKSPHNAIGTEARLGWKGRECESCHGPGEKHTQTISAADIRNPGKIPAHATDELCLGCHLNQTTPVGDLRSSHAKDQVPCIECHSVHGPAALVVRTIPAVNRQCANCHSDVWAQFQMPYRHKLPEGAMSCVDCHNPHGTIEPAMLQTFAANEPGCLNCHGDKRGPFTFEHAPVRFEGCNACHEPHGSENPRMLTRSQVRFVCLECHANLPTLNTSGAIGVVPPSFHDLNSPRYQNCTVCHQKVHGSYIDRNLLR